MDMITENLGWPWRINPTSLFIYMDRCVEYSEDEVIPADDDPSIGTESIFPGSSSSDEAVSLMYIESS
jgi:hypothetical protein